MGESAMSKSIKALLLSALVLPGAGHFYLRKNIQGLVLALVALVCLYVLISNITAISQDITYRVEIGEIPMDVGSIRAALENKLGEKTGELKTATYALEICWLIGVIDAFRIGRRQQKAEASESSAATDGDLHA